MARGKRLVMDSSVSRDGRRRVNTWLLVGLVLSVLTGCSDKKPAALNPSILAEFTDRMGQTHVKLFSYSGEAKIDNVRAFFETQPCNMLYAYFYPDSVPLMEIPVEEVRGARTSSEVNDILFQGEGYARWRFAARCFGVIPIVTDCSESSIPQDCR